MRVVVECDITCAGLDVRLAIYSYCNLEYDEDTVY